MNQNRISPNLLLKTLLVTGKALGILKPLRWILLFQISILATTASAAETVDLAENNAAQWGTFASDGKTTSALDSITRIRDGSASLLFTTESGFDTGLKFPANPTLNLNVSSYNTLAFWLYGENNNPGTWQGNQPIIVIKTNGGDIRLEPTSQKIVSFAWRAVKAPLAGGNGWSRTATGTPNLAQVTQIEIHFDTWGSGFRLWMDGLRFMNLDPAGLPPAGPPAPPGVNPDIVRSKVLLYVFNPILENRGSKRTHEVYGWQDPVVLANSMRQDLLNSSHGRAAYEIAETVIADEHSLFEDGFRHTDETFVRDWESRVFRESRFDYVSFCNTHRIGERIDAGEIDEVWLYASPVAGMWESCMAGKGAYFVNGGTYPAAGRERAFIIMGLNYERGVAEAIHSWGHRAESIMVHSYGSWQANRNTTWNRFTLLDKDAPGLGGVGNVHYPVNAQSDYDYDNSRFVNSNADAWLTYPNLNNQTRSFNFREWSSTGADTHRDYLNWWYYHMPHAPGRAPDYYLSNWWRYMMDVDQFKNTDGKLFLTIGKPHVRVTVPASGSAVQVGSSMTLRSDASVDGALGRVDFYIDGQFKGSDYLAPYTYDWTPQAGDAGARTITARAYELQNGTESISPPATIMVTTTGGGNANLSDLVSSTSAISPAFDPAVTSYSTSVDHSTVSITVTPTAAHANATLKVNGVPVISGQASGAISLVVGDNLINTEVTSQDGSVKQTYTLVVTRAGTPAEIAVEQPVGTNVVDGQWKGFGSVPVGTSASMTFTIFNRGGSDLTGLTITKDGSHADDFTVTANPSAPLNGPNGVTSLVVRFSPSGGGMRYAAIHIASNDSDEDPFDIDLSSAGVGSATSPEIVVEHPVGIPLVNGFDSRHLGAVAIGKAAAPLILTIRNTGNGTLTGLIPKLVGADAEHFAFNKLPSREVNPGASTTLTVQFSPTSVGAKTVTLSLANNDADEAPFTLQLSGVGESPTVTARPVVEDPGPQFCYVGERLVDPNVWPEGFTPGLALAASHNPDRFMVSGLPPGLRYDALSRRIVGQATAPKLDRNGDPQPYAVKISAANGLVRGDTITVDWTILPLPAGLVGGFTGLVERNVAINGVVDAPHGFGGLISFTVAGSGSVSGRLRSGSRSYPFRSRLVTASDGRSGQLAVEIKQKAPTPPILIGLTISLTDESLAEAFAGQVEQGDNKAPFSGWQDQTVPGSDLQGQFHAAIEANPMPESANPIPQGSGYAVVKVSSKGRAAWSGRLPDSTSITGSFGVGAQGELALFAMLNGNTGSVWGWSSINAGTDLILGDLDWMKLPQSARSRTRNYKAGIPLHGLEVSGGRYSLNAEGLILDFGQPLAANNGEITFTGGALDANVTEGWSQSFDLKRNNTLSLPHGGTEGNPNRVTLKLSATTGTFSGSFWQEGTGGKARQANYWGLLVPALNLGVGFHLLGEVGDPTATPATTDTTSPLRSGALLLRRAD